MTGTVVPLSAARPLAAASRCGGRDAAQWGRRLGRLLRQEIRDAVARGLLTPAEAEQMLARLSLVIDQAMSPAQP